MSLRALMTLGLLVACSGADETDATDTDTDTDTDVADTDTDTDTDTDVVADELAIQGAFVDQFFYTYEIDATSWDFYGSGTPGTITSWDNDAGWFVGQNSAKDKYNPDLWSRVDFVADGEGWLLCQIGFAAKTEADAIAAKPADATDVAKGCNGFPWSELRPGIDIVGSYTDDYKLAHEVTLTGWDSYDAGTPCAFSQYDNDAMWAVCQNDAKAEYFASLWSKYQWAYNDADELVYCQTAFNAKDEAEALSTPMLDTTDTSKGCGTSPWSILTPTP